MDYQHEIGLSKEHCYLNCSGYDAYTNSNQSVSVITDPQVIYQVQGNEGLPDPEDQDPIILDMSNNVKIESLSNVSESGVIMHLYSCTHCNLRFVQQSDLDSHYPYCMKKDHYQMSDISNKSKLITSPSNENSGPANNEANSCNICLKSFKTSELLSKHLNRTSSEDPVKCNLCSRMLHGPAGYLRHLKSHYGKSCEFCNECGKKFTTKKALTKHCESHNSIDNIKVITKQKVIKPNTCFVCEKRFVTKEKLEKHMKARQDDIPIKCGLCERTLHSSGYEYHVKAHVTLKYECLPCSLKFISLHELKKHKNKVHTDEKQFLCEVCKKCYKDSTGLKMHLRLHTGETPYSCDVCHMKFPFSSTLKYHKRIHSQQRPTFCCVCNISFPSMRELATHNRIHDGEKIYKCSCGKLFRLLTSLVIHQKNSKEKCVESTQVFDKKCYSSNIIVNTGSILHKGYSCEKCSRSFHTLKALEKHKQRKIHTSNKVEPTCKTCGKCFQTLAQLKKHDKVHIMEPAHPCSECNNCFVSVDRLKEHVMLSHSKEKKQPRIESCTCNTCGKVFAGPVNLKKHMRCHTGQRPYTCQVCSACFADRSTLNDHRIVHTEARNHVCNTCGKAFKSSRVLKIHSRVHQPDRPYQCNVCSSSFKHLGTLISHKVTHTGLKAHQCQICWMKFAYAKGLKRHRKMHDECKTGIKDIEHNPNVDPYPEYTSGLHPQTLHSPS